ncbi:hypothetical protein VSS74_13860 [Conexibacter stalactiti]|uniref:DUF998 domain-containing protein n=1 Tax=Conexibacter stalactiti TaxID=1940611 RepID=A0ABU4HSC0_9ACTN|nr:hypothetical protein [Conexibacter stalactiti]MDW5595430.1 hypothetical protein [Conexibacter stalactiti]MEC5036072.1 hypothetical protein [Conexibacter stalactiti]
MHTAPIAVRLGAAAALVAAAAFATLCGIHITHGTFDDDPSTTVEYVNLLAFAVALAGSALAAPALGAATAAPAWATRLACGGPPLVLVGVLATLVTGSSPSWFGVVAVPGNLGWLAGLTWMAVVAWRGRTLPRWAAAGLPLTVIAGVGLAQLGGGIVPALLWAYLAATALRTSVPRAGQLAS